MALSDVTSVLGKLAELAVSKAIKLYGVRDKVKAMQVELDLIQGILQDAESMPYKSQALTKWMNQLSDVAKRIDVVVDNFQKEIKDNSKDSMIEKLKFWKKPLKRNYLSGEIEDIMITLATLKDYHKLGLVIEPVGPVPLPPTPVIKPADIDDPQVVGFDSAKHQIISHLLDKSISRRTIQSIIGVGGLGKTTLAKKIYNSSQLKDHFDCRAWQEISHTFNKYNILRGILYSIKPEKEDKNQPIEDERLVTEVKSILSGKRYLIILDDVWAKDLWKSLENALPDLKNGSRVIITTRDVDVARAADRNTKECQLGFLTDDESLALLFKTSLQRDIQPEDYPPALKDVGRKLMKKCGGLPLALVVLGGILSTEEEHIFPVWNKIYENMDWHDEDGEKCMKTIEKSYEALPNRHLKQCFLYFASFPDDYHISAEHLINMWVAEELIPKPRAGTLEDQAEKYLQELVKRCLVQVTRKAWNGNCKYCRTHDLVRELAIKKAKEDKFFTIFSKEGDDNNQELVSSRLALHFYIPTGYDIHSTNHIRSLIIFGRFYLKGTSSYISNMKFKELRVLVFEHVNMRSIHKSSFKYFLEGLVHLRYLGFRHSKLPNKLFETITFSDLMSLETIDFSGTSDENFPNDSLWKIPTLRHVIGSSYPFDWPFYFVHSNKDCLLNWSCHKNLQTVKLVCFEDIPVIECNLNLRTLKIWNLYQEETGTHSAKEGWQRLKAMLSRADNLVSLTVGSKMNAPFLSDGTRGLTCHEKIQSLHVTGKWTCVPSVEMFPRNLTKLKLLLSHMKEDPMPILERLQSLRILHLLAFSYKGTKMTCSAGGFPSLQKLKVDRLYNLREWEIRGGAMTSLGHLKISMCLKLQQLPELQNVTSLQELEVDEAAVELLKAENQYKIEHVPSVRSGNVIIRKVSHVSRAGIEEFETQDERIEYVM